MKIGIRFFTVIEVLFSIVAVALSMRIMSSNFEMLKADEAVYCDMEYLVYLFPAICISNPAGVVNMDKKHKIELAPYITRSVAFLIMSFIVVVGQDIDTVLTASGITYGLSLLISRVFSIIRNHKPSYVTLIMLTMSFAGSLYCPHFLCQQMKTSPDHISSEMF